ncbi:MAG TPA: peptide chain release factor N(5)-glutamine methyltransferase [Pseudomonas sp.]|mgnify:FL=1|jgi:release factor glutamine methyltransferase|uniref:peptide chain release factor N(5)-glutamine methyltransferase n=1 Tax=Stutzerimonas xanthomarina TaxID=271420 RepID=UPI000E93F871|nr:peptide chain release factor N(5)-glutamine methyltransferase [Stutzerimonas xanthomarina]MBU0810568.1 peptide chain release factor N(5)-glutamine methyltransferase [Gammaproteobacteria bacterium]HAQ88016.1 peptide chain release factor N(5)-glutamine methyltransferase [Pseudomonas sp.]MBK3846785.1 peptide chain release factor N(5)-glutamine methyltransferase [Stutzerimonas xanthomarina]MBU0852379.1 peptide chain release factor N(5)-glutamine methyltransferase [Gammaproteobacteria bacterium]|tara:strand:+ start:1071 stop:1901 length:831 start_codon:yes stop_codon:yes gene_type:complete
MATIDSLLRAAQLPDSPSAKLDAEWLLAAVLGRSPSYLRTWPEREVLPEDEARFVAHLERRRLGEPVAYILGRQGFWSLELEVAPHTLIPRPDTELLVETAMKVLPAGGAASVLDLGTGTGAIALALASERPAWQITGVDRVTEAVALAARNAQRLGLGNAAFHGSHWFSSLRGQRFELIVSNPPYIPASDPHLSQGDVRFEPSSALVSGVDGLDDIRLIIAQAPDYLSSSGWLVLEHGYDQASAVRSLLSAGGFVDVASCRDFGGHERVSLGRLP